MTPRRFYDRVEEAEGLARAACPSAADVERACDLLRDVQVAYWFFEEALAAENPAWLPALHEQGYFQEFPEPDDEGRAWVWPAGKYVTQFAAAHPEPVLAVIGSADTNNTSVYEALTDAAASLPIEYTAQATGVLASWIPKSSLWLPEKMADVMRRLALEGQKHAASVILRALLQVKETSRDPKLGISAEFVLPVHEFGDHLWPVVQAIALEDAAFAVRELEKILLGVLALRGWKRGRRHDYSYIWRESIQDDHGLIADPRDILVSAIREVLVAGAKASPCQIRPVLERYLGGRNLPYVLTRIALHLLARHSECYWDLVEAALQRRGWIRRHCLAPEYRQLLTVTFEPLLDRNPPLAQRVLRRIDRLPRDRQADWLEALPKPLSPVRARRLHSIREEQARERQSARVEREVPLPDLAALRVADVAPELREPEVDAYRADRLPMAFQDDVRKRSPEYVAHLGKFLPGSVPPRYISSLLNALREAARGGAGLDWSRVFDYCAAVAGTAPDDLSVTLFPGNALPRDWFLTAIADLVTTAVQKHAVPQPEAAKELLQRILARSHELAPTREKAAPADQAPWDRAFNDAHAQALAGIIELGRDIAVRAHPGLSTWPDKPIIDGDVKHTVEAEVGRPDGLGLAARSVLGQHLPVLGWLDMGWLKARLDVILPRGDDALEEWWAAWGAYLFFNRYYSRIMEALRDRYAVALDRVHSPRRPEWAEASDEGLLVHLMNAMCLGDEPHDDPDSLSGMFFAKAPPQLRGSAIRLLGRWLKDSEFPDPKQMKGLLRSLWVQRLRALSDAEDRQRLADEVVEFTWWLHADFAPPAEIEDLIDRIVPLLPGHGGGHHLIKYCGRYAHDQPAALRLLNALLRQPRPFSVLYHKDSVRSVLEAARSCGDPSLLAEVDYAVNRLGELGQRDFRNLLPSRRPSS